MRLTALIPALLLTLFFAFTSCKGEKKSETAPSETEVQSEAPASDLTAEVRYQCPMDCEHGKTYDAEGKCPVCKMDLKPVSKETAMTCTMHADGKCTCDEENCACENCPEHPAAQ
ncbi:heavy metal-binding domain-containing protein [Robiginitalea sp.]|uniref:heavy metal-binding domain-containing protein n=1 Tax=Robiginitalea sp. TaxID=1902411 RepID=UPI003C77E165